jgi:hypothetical protein
MIPYPQKRETESSHMSLRVCLANIKPWVQMLVSWKINKTREMLLFCNNLRIIIALFICSLPPCSAKISHPFILHLTNL